MTEPQITDSIHEESQVPDRNQEGDHESLGPQGSAILSHDLLGPTAEQQRLSQPNCFGPDGQFVGMPDVRRGDDLGDSNVLSMRDRLLPGVRSDQETPGPDQEDGRGGQEVY